MSNSLIDAGPCKEARSGRHAWLDVTTENEEPGKHYLCTNCGAEAFDVGEVTKRAAAPMGRLA